MSKVRFLLSLLIAAGFTFAIDFAGASNWPRFRGPDGNGISDCKTIPIKWTENDYLWKVELPGNGNSSPIIWDKQLFIQTASKDNTERLLHCLDVKNGSTKWVQKAGGQKAKMHKMNTLASQSPGVDAERVYAVFWDGKKQIINGYSHAGKFLWTHDFGSFTAQHGAGTSPIAFGGKVFFNNDQDTKAELVCLDGKTGEVVWSDQRGHNTACYATPVIRMLPDGKTPELIVATTKGITGYDPDKGTKRWDWQWQFRSKILLRTTASPFYEGGLLYASSGDNGQVLQRHAVAIRIGVNTPETVWENINDFPYISTPVVYGKHLYCISDSGMAGCYEADTGKRLWFEKLEGTFSSSPIVIDGKIYVGNDFGQMYVIATNPQKLEILAENNFGEMIRATPAVADERLFVRGQKYLYCIGKK